MSVLAEIFSDSDEESWFRDDAKIPDAVDAKDVKGTKTLSSAEEGEIIEHVKDTETPSSAEEGEIIEDVKDTKAPSCAEEGEIIKESERFRRRASNCRHYTLTRDQDIRDRDRHRRARKHRRTRRRAKEYEISAETVDTQRLEERRLRTLALKGLRRDRRARPRDRQDMTRRDRRGCPYTRQ
jgi:hypothetical protein